jgi:electron transfer flavoprotein beta subunit
VDLVFCGLQAIDGDTAQVGPMLAERLGLPQATYVEDLRLEGKKVVARRRLEDGCQVIQCRLPLLVTVIKEINEPRIPTYAGLCAALERGVVLKTAADLELDTQRLGLSGSPTAVIRVWTPETRSAARVLTGEPAELASQLADILMERVRP